MSDTPLSLRDPAGRLLIADNRILRLVEQNGIDNLRALFDSPTVADWQSRGKFVRTRELPAEDWPTSLGDTRPVAVLEHESVWFVSHPCEWSPSMLRVAGSLTIDLASELLDEHRGLKDATPLNVLFTGNRPVFVDALSVENRDPRNPVWLPYGQFIRTFVLPLIACRQLNWSLRRVFTGARDGPTPEELFDLLGWRSRLSQGVFGAVTGPVLFSRLNCKTTVATTQAVDERRATFVIRSLLAQLNKALNSQDGVPRHSPWTAYRDPAVHTSDYHAVRFELIDRMLRSYRPRRVLDIGANDGAFSMLAAVTGADVVAIDRDERVVEQMFRRQAAASVRVLPLVVDVSDPTPATGWRNSERHSFLDRATGRFDCVLCMAVLHHLVVGDGLPLRAVIDLMATLTTDMMIAEFVPVHDPWCMRLAAGRPVPPERWSFGVFETEVTRHFTIVSRHAVSDQGRVVFLLRKSGTA